MNGIGSQLAATLSAKSGIMMMQIHIHLYGPLRDRLAPEVLAADRERLLRERARRRAGLPLLSLFSPDALER